MICLREIGYRVEMDMDFNGDLLSLDAELLQLPEVSPLALKSNPFLAQDLFEQWLSLPETNRLVSPFFVCGDCN